MTSSFEAEPHDASLFAGAAYYYARYRPPYPPAALNSIAAQFRLGPGVEVLDLGVGTGQIALPLSRTGSTVWALDPDAEMIVEGVRAQAADGYGNVRWILARGEDLLAAGLPQFRVCVIGASFHWMERDFVLEALDHLIEPGGGVAILSGSASIFSVNEAVNAAWLGVTRDVVRHFLGPERRAGQGTYSHPKRTHEDVLRDSAFNQLSTQRFTSVRLLSVDEVVGQQLSTSYASPARLGGRLPEFRSELSARLQALVPEDGFETVEHTDLIVGQRIADVGLSQ